MINLPKYSIIIPARDEEKYLPACLTSIIKTFKQASEANYEIIVVLNRSSDRTEEIALSYGAIIVKDDSKNLSMIRNTGLKAAKGDILITVDADSILSENMVSKISSAMKNGDTAGGGVLIYPERWSVGIIFCGFLIALLAAWYRVSAGLFFFSKNAFNATGGFDETKLSAEDIDFAVRLKRYAKKNKLKYKNLFSAYIVTSCRKFDKFGDWYFLTMLPSMLRLLKGKNKVLADKIWYDFPRD